MSMCLCCPAGCPAVHPCALTLHVHVHISLLSSRTSVLPCGACLSVHAASGCRVSGASLRANTSPAPVMPEVWAHSHLYSHLWSPATTSITATNNLQVSGALPGAVRLVTGTVGPRCSQQTRGDGESPRWCPPYDMYIIQSYPEQHNTLKNIYSYVQYL